MEIHPIARIHSDFPGKFGIPRQSGLVPELRSRIIFEPEYRNRDAVRGLEDFSHLWLIWEFSETIRVEWSPTVRPPKLGGNKRMGVFATRSPFRPNSLALSCVELQDIIFSKEDGPILEITGADLMDRTPIYDIKPYLPYADCKPLATGGFTDSVEAHLLHVILPDNAGQVLPAEKLLSLEKVLAQDPRPSYQNDPERIYAFEFAGVTVRFFVQGYAVVCDIHVRPQVISISGVFQFPQDLAMHKVSLFLIWAFLLRQENLPHHLALAFFLSLATNIFSFS